MDQNENRSIPELVAPAGSVESFWAALEAGADAVYMGLSNYNARKRARNFSQSEFQDAVLVAHKRGKRVFAALNTLVLDDEMPAFCETASFLHETGVDAVIVQDLGILNLLRTLYPSLRVHASTQMFCHNSQQAAFLKKAGVARIVLARELSIAEIAAIGEKVPHEYEIFVHGAMCFAFSGCCLFSAQLYGESGNRGECRQPCRMQMGVVKTPYPFSMKDLCAGPVLEDLLAAKPTALKIEGRQKNAAYVSAIVSYYRKALDDYAQHRPITPPEPDLAIQRKTGPGYLPGTRNPGDLTDSLASGTLGQSIGNSARIEKGHVLFSVAKPLCKGMRLRVQDESGRNWVDATLLSFTQTKAGKRFRVDWDPGRPLPNQIPQGELRVYFLGMSGETGAVAAMRNELRGQKPFTVDVSLVFEWDRIRVSVTDKRMGISRQTEVTRQVAPDNPIEMRKENIDTLFRETADTPFHVNNIELEMQGASPWTFRELKGVRRGVFTDFAEFHKQQLAHSREQTTQQVNALLSTEGIPEPMHEPESVLLELSTTPASRDALLQLPIFVPEEQVGLWHDRIRLLIGQGHCRWVLPTYGWLPFFAQFDKVEVYCGSFFYAGNVLSRRFLSSWKPAGIFESADKGMAAQGHRSPDNHPRTPLLFTRVRTPDGHWQWRGKEIRVIHHENYDELILDA